MAIRRHLRIVVTQRSGAVTELLTRMHGLLDVLDDPATLGAVLDDLRTDRAAIKDAMGIVMPRLTDASALARARGRPASHGVAPHGRARRTEASSMSACTKACGRLPRSWRWVTSYSSENRPGGPHAVRLRSNQRWAPRMSPC